MESVQNQTYKNLTHYLFLDGQDVHVEFDEESPVKTIRMQENIGKGWYGHRVYAACSFLVNADIICYLDEDNWIEPNHLQDIVDAIKQGNDWAYSLRKIYNKDGEFVCEDNCESLGQWPVFFNDAVHHVDTSCFAVKRSVAVAIGHAWYGQWGADRQFLNALKQYFPKVACTNKYSLCYRLDGNPNSVTKEFFEQGNAVMQQKYPNGFPWNTKSYKEEILGPGIKIVSQ
jgi:glycosyltransferase involved in cell wall biosynthesis